jgi:hypothetical protein
MRRCEIVCVIAACALAVTACGTSKEEKAAKEAKQVAEAVAKQAATPGGGGVADMAKGMQEMAKGFQQMAGQGGDAQAPVEPVSFRELQTVMPDLEGWEKGKPTGEKMSAPIAMSQSEVSYTKDEARIEAKVVDTGFRQMFFLPFTMMMAAGYEKETSDGYEKATMVGTYPGFEKWDESSKRGELAVAVNKRFYVSVEGNSIQNTAVLRELMSKMDLGKLAGMK